MVPTEGGLLPLGVVTDPEVLEVDTDQEQEQEAEDIQVTLSPLIITVTEERAVIMRTDKLVVNLIMLFQSFQHHYLSYHCIHAE